MADVFVSYSRKDRALVVRLHEALRQTGRETWVDWEGIPPTAEWIAEIRSAIESADNFLFVISPDSIASRICGVEIEHAVLHRKRLIPIVSREVDAASVPESLGNLNWIFFTSDGAFDSSFKQLITALDTDLEWVKEHTRFLVRGLQWDARGRNDAFLLRGSDLTAAEGWLAKAGAQQEMRPTQLHVEYITASRRGATKRLRVLLASVAFGAAVAIVLAVIAFRQSNIAEERRKEAKNNADRAETNAGIARKNEADAKANAKRAEDNAVIAEQRRKEAEEQRKIAVEERDTALSRELATNSVTNLAADPELSLLLAREAARVKRTDQAEQTLRRALLESHVRLVMKGHSEPLSSVAFSKDGTRLVTGSKDMTARIWNANTGGLLRELKGHTGSVHHVAFSPDARRVLTVGDYTARIWDAESGSLLHVLKGDVDFQIDAAYSPDGSMVVTAGRREQGKEDSLGRVWDAATGKLLAALEGHASALTSAAFTPDSKQVATGSYDGTARLWDARTGRAVYVFKGHQEVITSLAISPDGRFLITGCWDKIARLWDLKSGKLLGPLTGHAEPILAVAFSPDSKLAVTAGRDGTARVWSTARRLVQAELRGHTGAINSVEFSRDGNWLVTAGDDGTARIWEANTRGAAQQRDADMFDETKQVAWRNIGVLMGHRGKVSAAAFRPDGLRLATAGDDFAARIWEPQVYTPQQTFAAGSEGKVAFEMGGAYLVTAPESPHEDSPVRVWNTATGKPVAEPSVHFRFSRDGSWAATSQSPVRRAFESIPQKGQTKVWDAKRWSALARITGDDAEFSTDSKWLVTYDVDRTLVWQAGTWKKVAELPGARGGFSPDAARLCSKTTENVEIWRTGSWARVLTIPGTFSSDRCFFQGDRIAAEEGRGFRFWDAAGHVTSTVPGSMMREALLSADGRWGVRPQEDKLQIYDARTGRMITDLEAHGPVEHYAFSPKSTLVAAALRNGNVTVWELGTWRTLAVLRGHRGEVHDFAFSPDERFLATAGEDKSARVWDLRTGGVIMELRQHTGSVSGVAFSPDGRRVATAGEEGVAHIFRCAVCAPLDELIAMADAQATRPLSAPERVKFLHDLTAERQDAETTLARARQLANLGDVNGAAEAFERAVQGGAKLYRKPLLEAQILAAGSLISRSDLHAERLEVELAVQERRKAKALAPGLVKDPEREAGKIAAEVLSGMARRHAEAGRLALAEQELARAEQLDASLKEGGGARRVREWAALPLHNEAYEMSKTGDRAAVAAILRKAAAVDPNWGKDPEREAAALVTNAEKLLVAEFNSAGSDYRKILQLTEQHPWVVPKVDAGAWARACHFGVTQDPAAVLSFCDRAVQLKPNEGWIRKNRAAARLLTQDLKGAAEDLEIAIAQSEEPEEKQRNMDALAEVRAGKNPFAKPGARDIDMNKVQNFLR